MNERTFEEIAKAMNITNGGAQFLYKSAIAKLKRRGIDIEKMREMAEELEHNRASGNSVTAPRGKKP